MARESLSQRQKRTQGIVAVLAKSYPDAHCALVHSNPLELLVATVLSAQCTDERVNRVTPELFRRFPSAETLARASVAELERLVKPTGFFKNKARALKGIGEQLVARFSGEVPRKLEDLQSLPGVGRKTANVVMGNAFGIASGIVVDTHVKRLCYRLGLTTTEDPEQAEVELQKLVEPQHWILFSHWLIFHGRKICKARRPDCAHCPLTQICLRRGVDR